MVKEGQRFNIILDKETEEKLMQFIIRQYQETGIKFTKAAIFRLALNNYLREFE